ncbi:CCT_1a_G0028310.mRNA.1.CDS.1 [Saccharomyces cerevisiae]|nr:CCT_1a_G0028310.mRNA.1.CDS.1 [Saccharomyces cerevisiae]CAI7348936.1 CCT_1a_G0028310.mRNA.1.CDS.1 [Saccharomyces cerevisiae]
MTLVALNGSFIDTHLVKGAAIALTVLFIVTTLIYSFQVVWDARKASKPEVDNPFDTPVDKCESITAIILGRKIIRN